MKICMMGPVPSNTVFGGVAQFNKALAEGFSRNGCEVFFCSEQLDDGLMIDYMYYKIGFMNVKKVMENEVPDLIIASLSYLKYFSLINKNCVKAYFMHGFFNIGHYGFIKASLGWLFQKVLENQCDRIYANSDYTRVINTDIMGLRVDRTALIGVSENLIQRAQLQKIIPPRKTCKMTFAGRLSKGKRISAIMGAVCELHSEGFDFSFDVIGDGDEIENLKYIANGNSKICFWGKLSQEELFDKELQSEIFISLDPSESYGMVYVEALMAGCKIVCPQTGGQIEILKDYSDRVVRVNPLEVSSIKEGIRLAFSLEPLPLATQEFGERFSYNRTAAVILNDIKNM